MSDERDETFTSSRAREVAEYLDGSSKSAAEAAEQLGLTEEEVLDLAVLGGVDNCAGCGWWSPIEEMTSDGADLLCEECASAD